jgi:hypothetical protein
MLLLVAGTGCGALGLFIFFTERGVANEIKGFVLLLIAGVLLERRTRRERAGG